MIIKQYCSYFLISFFLIFFLSLYFQFHFLNQRKVSSSQKPDWSMKTVCIVGGGLSGISAAIEAASNQEIEVILLEKEAKVGGNSAKASSGINACFSQTQIKQNIKDSYESFYQDTKNSGHGESNEELIDFLVKNSTEALEFLEKHGVVLDDISLCGGHHVPRTHRQKNSSSSVGWIIISKLMEEVQKLKNVKILSNSTVKDLIVENNEVVGLTYENEGKLNTLKSSSVILTTGGFSFNKEWIKKYQKEYEKLPTTCGAFSMGDGIKMAEAIGADIVQMENIQIHPTGYLNPENLDSNWVFLCPEAMRGLGSLLVDENGKRFVNELDTRDNVANSILKNGKHLNNGKILVYLIMNEEIEKNFGKNIFEFYKSR